MPVDLTYYDEKPSWRVVAPDPSRFRGVEYQLEFRLFRMPTGALVASWLRLYDVPGQPFFLHRVLDLGDGPVLRYHERLRDAGELVLSFESRGEQEGFSVAVPVRALGLRELLEEGRLYNERLAEIDGREALDRFLEVFNTALRERGNCGAAWRSVEERLGLRRSAARSLAPTEPAPRPWTDPVRLALIAIAAFAAGIALTLLFH